MAQSHRLQRRLAACRRHDNCPMAPPIFRIYEKPLALPGLCIYTKGMETEWDPIKNRMNRAKHGLDFGDFEGFDAEPVVVEDTRFDYGETRFRAFGRIDGIGHSLAYTLRGATMRIIAFRRAHEKEMRRYERPPE